jgi:hypothetical protein
MKGKKHPTLEISCKMSHIEPRCGTTKKKAPIYGSEVI